MKLLFKETPLRRLSSHPRYFLSSIVCVLIVCFILTQNLQIIQPIFPNISNFTLNPFNSSWSKITSHLYYDRADDTVTSGNMSHKGIHTILDVYLNLSLHEYHQRLRKRGLEPSSLHEFKSPYIIDPVLDDKDITIRKVPGNRTVKIISIINRPVWYRPPDPFFLNHDFKRCPYSECQFDPNGKRPAEAELVIFFPGPTRLLPRPMRQIWAYCTWESPVHYGFPKPYHKWKDAFNWTIGYRMESDLFCPYDHFSWTARDTLLPDSEYRRIAKKKTKTAAWVVSHCDTINKRENYIAEMKKYIDIDIYGKCGKLKCSQAECMKKFNTSYKFYLSFENSDCKDYVTEKHFKNFRGRFHVVSVVSGGFDYEKYFPKGTFINAKKFDGPKALALYLKEVGNDVGKYAELLKEKDKLRVLTLKIDWCELCEKLHKSDKHKTIPDIKKYSTKNICHN